MAKGPPATGTCQTIVMYGVELLHGALGTRRRAGDLEGTAGREVDGPHVFVRWCHCTRGP